MVGQTNYWFEDRAATQESASSACAAGSNPTDAAPANMALIPAGIFQMGDTFYEGATYELPVHSVDVRAFYMDKFEVSKGLWDRVRTWSAGPRILV